MRLRLWRRRLLPAVRRLCQRSSRCVSARLGADAQQMSCESSLAHFSQVCCEVWSSGSQTCRIPVLHFKELLVPDVRSRQPMPASSIPPLAEQVAARRTDLAAAAGARASVLARLNRRVADAVFIARNGTEELLIPSHPWSRQCDSCEGQYCGDATRLAFGGTLRGRLLLG